MKNNNRKTLKYKIITKGGDNNNNINNTRKTGSKYNNINKRISSYQETLRSLLKKSNNLDINVSINDDDKKLILEMFGIPLDDIIKILNNFLKRYNRYLIHCEKIQFAINHLTQGYQKHKQYVASRIVNIILYDNYGFRYTFTKKEFGTDPTINHNKLSKIIFLNVLGFYNFNKDFELTDINDINSILILPKSIPIAPKIMEYVKKIGQYPMLLDRNLHLINYIENNK